MNAHLTMEQLLAVRDGDRSEPPYAEAHRHVAECLSCRAELERLHQRTARLRALPTLAPVHNLFPAVRQQLVADVRHRRRRVAAVLGLATAAGLVIALVGRDLVRPSRLDAETQLQNEISNSQQLEQKLEQWNPDDRVLDGRTAIAVLQLEDKIAELDAQISDAAGLADQARLDQELKLWRQRVGLMNALVDVHLSKASNVGL